MEVVQGHEVEQKSDGRRTWNAVIVVWRQVGVHV